VVCGKTRPQGRPDFNPYVVKTDSQGNEQWTVSLDSAPDYLYGGARSIRQAGDGSYIITGGGLKLSVDHAGLFILKLAVNGGDYRE
jgi:hypothetical protein